MLSFLAVCCALLVIASVAIEIYKAGYEAGENVYRSRIRQLDRWFRQFPILEEACAHLLNPSDEFCERMERNRSL
jgi:hypothetical protein